MPIITISAICDVQKLRVGSSIGNHANDSSGRLEDSPDNRRTVYLEKSGHFVQRDDPDSIVMAIEAEYRSYLCCSTVDEEFYASDIAALF
jgi:hypothetical protein